METSCCQFGRVKNIYCIEEVKRIMKEVKEYLKNYNIIKLEEIEYVRENDNKKWHFYDIIAQKKEGDNHE